MQPANPDITTQQAFERFMRILRVRGPLTLALVIAGNLVWGFIVHTYFPPVYEASAVIEVLTPRAMTTFDSEAGVGRGNERDYLTELAAIGELLPETILGNLVDGVRDPATGGLARPGGRIPEAACAAFANSAIQYEAAAGTWRVRVWARSTNWEYLDEYLAEAIQIYMNRKPRVTRDIEDRSMQLGEIVSAFRRQRTAEEAEALVQRYVELARDIGVDRVKNEYEALVAERLSYNNDIVRLDKLLSEKSARVATLQKGRAALEKGDVTGIASGLSGGVDDAVAAHRAAQVSFDEVRAAFGEKHPEHKRASARLDGCRTALMDAVVGLESALLRDIAETEAIQKQYTERLRALDKELAAAMERKQIIDEYTEAESNKAEVLRVLEAQIQAMRISVGTNPPVVTVIEPVPTWTAPPRPVEPNMLRHLLAATVLMALAGFGIGSIRELARPRLQRPEDVESLLGVRCLGVVPLVAGSRAGAAELGTICRDKPRDPVSEQVSTIASTVLLAGPEAAAGQAPRATVVLVTSSQVGEGKTTLAANLAFAIARMHRRVLVIDADLSRSSLKRLLGVEEKMGLSQALQSGAPLDAILIDTGFTNLTAVTAGPPVEDPSRLLHDAHWRALIEEARSRFDVIVVDSPPALVSDPLVLSLLANAVVYVASQATPIGAVAEGLRRLRGVGAAISGVILNKHNTANDQGYGGYGGYGPYGYYYRPYVSRPEAGPATPPATPDR